MCEYSNLYLLHSSTMDKENAQMSVVNQFVPENPLGVEKNAPQASNGSARKKSSTPKRRKSLDYIKAKLLPASAVKAREETSDTTEAERTPVSSKKSSVRISSEDVVQVLMQRDDISLAPGTPAKIVGDNLDNGTLLVRTTDGGVYHVRADTILNVTPPQGEQLRGSSDIFDKTIDAIDLLPGRDDQNVDNASITVDIKLSPITPGEFSFEVVQSNPYEKMSLEELKSSIATSYEALVAAVQIEGFEHLKRILGEVEEKQSILNHLGFPAPSKISSHVTMTRAQIQTAVEEKKFEKCSNYQNRLDILIEHEKWVREATKNIQSVVSMHAKLNDTLNGHIQQKNWGKCAETKANIELVADVIKILQLDSCDSPDDIENHIAKVEGEIGEAMAAGNYGVCADLNEKIASLHAARKHAQQLSSQQFNVSASFDDIEDDIRRTRLKTDAMRPVMPGNTNVISRLSPENLKAHNARHAIDQRSVAGMDNDDAGSFISNFTSVSMAENSFVFKLTDKDGNTHRFRSAAHRYDALLRKCAVRMKTEEEKLSLKYEDEDGDMVLLLDDDDVKESVSIARGRGLKFLRLVIVQKEDAKPPNVPIPAMSPAAASFVERKNEDTSSISSEFSEDSEDDASSSSGSSHEEETMARKRPKVSVKRIQYSGARNTRNGGKKGAGRRRCSTSSMVSDAEKSMDSTSSSELSSCSDSFSSEEELDDRIESMGDAPERTNESSKASKKSFRDSHNETMFSSFFAQTGLDKYADRAKNTEEENERLDTTLAVVLAASVTVLGVLFLSRR